MEKLPPSSTPRSVARHRGGAVMVEFLIAFMPVFLFFTGLVQLSLLRAGQIITQAAAERTARAASVVLSDDPKFYNGEAPNRAPGGDTNSGTSASIRYDQIRRAAFLATRPLRSSGNETVMGAFTGGGDENGADDALTVECDGNPNCQYAPGAMITVAVKYDYACIVPIGRIICGADFKKQLRAYASMPNFAAEYEF